MNKKTLFPNIDLADAEYRAFEMKNKILTIYFSSWDACIIRMVFSNPIQFFYKLGDIVSDAYEILDNSPTLNASLSLKYEKIPSNHPFKLYQIVDIQDFPFIEVIAEKTTLFKDNKTMGMTHTQRLDTID